MAGSHEDRTLTQAARPAARARPVAEPLPLVAQRYRDVSLLGRGGMGEVRRVIDERLERPVAMKILHAGHEISEEGRALFLAEARLTARLQHPGVVAVHDVGELPDGRLWFTMAEIEGRTLAAAQAEGDLTFRRLVDVLARVATVVAYAHARHVVHLDVKPSNIMLGPFGEVYLVDWGISALVRRQGQVAGSPAYMSPEQARGDATGPATDVYALGLILRELLTGESAPPGTASELVARAAQGPPPPLPEQPLDRTELGSWWPRSWSRRRRRGPRPARSSSASRRGWMGPAAWIVPVSSCTTPRPCARCWPQNARKSSRCGPTPRPCSPRCPHGGGCGQGARLDARGSGRRGRAAAGRGRGGVPALAAGGLVPPAPA
ncbi:MAG: serine/threonine-protein kinase [bacterium]